MTTPEYKATIVALMYGSGLNPLFHEDENYFEELTLKNVESFMRGVTRVFEIDEDYYMFQWWNIGDIITSPIETLDWFLENKKLIESGAPDD